MFNGTMDDAAHVVFKYFSSKLNFLFVDFTFLGRQEKKGAAEDEMVGWHH